MHPQESITTTDTDWRLWCRLCAKEDPQNNINIFFKEEHLVGGAANGNDLGLVDAVRKYFWVNITSIDELPKMLCTECFSRVTSMVNFSDRVSKVQQMFWTLQNSHANTKLHLQSLRLQYGLLAEESEQVIQRQLPEVHYVEEKPIIDELEENVFKVQTTAKNPLEPTRISIKINKKNLLDKERENEDVSDLDDKDFGNETESERDDGDNESVKQTKLKRNSRKRKQSIGVSVSQQAEKYTTKIKKRKNKSKRKRDKDFGNETEPELDDVDDESFAQTTFQRTTRKRVQRIGVPVSQQKAKEENHTTTLKIRKNKPKRKLKQTKRNDNSLDKSSENAKDVDVEKLAAPINNWINFEDETETESDDDDDEDFVPRKYTEEAEKETEKVADTANSLKKVKVGKRAKPIKGAAVCDVCKKFFPNHSALRRHQEVHAPNKHTCPVCGLQLNTRNTFRDHMVVHSDVMKYKCDYCGRGFKRIKTMQNHLILHTGLRPFLCEFCGRTFPTSVNCRTHKTLAHRKELAAIEATKASGRKTLQSVGNQCTQVENSQVAPIITKEEDINPLGKSTTEDLACRLESPR